MWLVNCWLPVAVTVWDTLQHFNVPCGVTKWRGTALHCPHLGNEIGLSHKRFHDHDGTSKWCREITGWSIKVEGDNYISQLIVPINFEPNGMTIKCVHENLLTNAVSVIGHIRLNLTTGMLIIWTRYLSKITFYISHRTIFSPWSCSFGWRWSRILIIFMEHCSQQLYMATVWNQHKLWCLPWHH